MLYLRQAQEGERSFVFIIMKSYLVRYHLHLKSHTFKMVLIIQPMVICKLNNPGNVKKKINKNVGKTMSSHFQYTDIQ